MDEARIGRILKQWAQPDPAFREDLLQRCLLVLDRDGGAQLDDASLEMLAAAGPGFSDDLAFDDDPKKA